LNINNMKEGENKVLIRKNNNTLFNSVRDVIDIYNKKTITENFAYFLSSLQNLSLIEVNDYFKQNQQRNEVMKAIIPLDNLTDFSKNAKLPQPPFVKTKPKKPYTLVLDLDETLIHLKINKDGKGVITFRPGLFDFLEEMSKLYELVLFTCGTQQYAEPIIAAIEKKRTFFDYKLYRDHTSFLNGDYVKDLSMIGRDMSRMLIVDNIPQNFRLQKDNGIFIKSFYSDNTSDTSLNELTNILKRLIQNSPSDIRKELSLYKNEIVKKVSTNLFSRTSKMAIVSCISGNK